MNAEYKEFSFFYKLVENRILFDDIFCSYLWPLANEDVGIKDYYWKARQPRRRDKDYFRFEEEMLKSKEFIEYLVVA